jgi:hypothetical protein
MQGTGNNLRKRKKCISNYDNQRRPFEDSYVILSFFSKIFQRENGEVKITEEAKIL